MQNGTYQAERQAKRACCREKSLIVGPIPGEDDDIQDNTQSRRYKIIEGCIPDAKDRPLFRIVGEKRPDGLRSHVADGVADHIDDVQSTKGCNTVPLAGKKCEHPPQRQRFNGISKDQKKPDLSKPCVHPVIEESKKRIRDGVQDSRAHQDDADDGCCDSVSDARTVAGKSDQNVDRHAADGTAGTENNFPECSASVVNTICLTGRN